jgi:geranylgeranyl pyrophosphate synthase
LSEFSGEKGLLLGQYIDLSSSNTKLEERIELNKLKTGMLMSFCCQAVAICAGKSKKIEKSLADIGMYIGEIFQINDDFEDFPRISSKNKKFLENYKLKLSQKIFSIFKKINLKNKKTYLLIEFLLDLKV